MTVAAGAVPAAKRRSFVDTAVRRWSPFSDPGFHFEWAGERAMVWAWSAGEVLDPGLPVPRRVLPEAIFRGVPREEGAELVAMDHGVEGRLWRDRLLLASQWWSGVPSLQEWNQFRRGGSLGTDAAVPEPLVFPLSEVPWSAAPRQGLGDLAVRHRSLLAVFLAGASAALLAAMLAAALSLWASIRLVDREIAAQDESLQHILASRDAAVRDADEIDALLALRPPAGQLELLDEVLRLLPKSGWELLEWRMPDPATLQLVVRMQRADPASLVQSWEASPYFDQVTVQLGNRADEISIQAGIARPDAAPAPRDATTAVAK